MSAVGNILIKYLRLSSSSGAVLAMTVISVVGIAIGVATLTVTLSVANGFGEAYRKSILDFNAHVVLLSSDEINNYQPVLKEIQKFGVTDEEQKSWKDLRYLVAILRPVERLWNRVDDIYADVTYAYAESPRLLDFLEKSHPRAVAGLLYSKGLYPKALVRKIVQILDLSQRGVVGANPFIYREGLLIANGQIRGIVIKGVDPAGFRSVSNMQLSIPEAKQATGGTIYQIYLGKYLAKELGINVGDKVRIMLPEHWKGGVNKGFEEFGVAGVFESGMYDFDSQFALLDLADAQKVFNAPDTVSGIEIKLDDWRKSGDFVMSMERVFMYPFYAASWQELNRSLFEAVKLEKLMFIIIMGALVVVAAFNIIGTVMLRILYKTSDISILRALGMDLKSVEKIFVMQGVIVGLLGTVIGLVLALLLIWSVGRFEWIKIPPEIYLLKSLPVCFSWPASVMIAAFSLVVCWITSVVASRRVLELKVVRGLHRP